MLFSRAPDGAPEPHAERAGPSGGHAERDERARNRDRRPVEEIPPIDDAGQGAVGTAGRETQAAL